MIQITKKDGETKTYAFCDTCGHGFEYGANVSITRVENQLRKEGWKIGKRHTCEKCKGK